MCTHSPGQGQLGSFRSCRGPWTSQRAAVSPTLWPVTPHPPPPLPHPHHHNQCKPCCQTAHLSKSSFTPLRTVWDGEENGDLLDLCAILRLYSIRPGFEKDVWSFTFPQTTAWSSATRPGLCSCVLKTTPWPPHWLPEQRRLCPQPTSLCPTRHA